MPNVSKRTFSTAQRDAAASKGNTMPDGSFPINTVADLRNAIQAFGRAKDKAKAKAHIIRMARKLKRTDLLPDGWISDSPVDKAGGADRNRGNAEALRHYFTRGEGAAKINWGTEGDFNRCVALVSKHMDPEHAKGYCQLRHKEATGDYTGDAKHKKATVAKAEDARYTLSPVYVPGTLDAHGEFTTTESLQKALWRYARNSDRSIRLQHNTTVIAGEWVELVTWPHSVAAEMILPDSSVQVAKSAEFPPGTAYMGIIWEPWAWRLIKAGKLTGLSMGGTARRVQAEFDEVPIAKSLTDQIADLLANEGIDPDVFTEALANRLAARAPKSSPESPPESE